MEIRIQPLELLRIECERQEITACPVVIARLITAEENGRERFRIGIQILVANADRDINLTRNTGKQKK